MHGSEGFHGPWQPATGVGASQPSPSDYAAASLRSRAAAGIVDIAGDAAAADEIASGLFSPFVATAEEQYARLVTLGSITNSDVVCDIGFGDGRLLCGIVKMAECTGCGCEVNTGLVASARALAVSCGFSRDAVVLTESGIARYLLTDEFRRATVIICFLVPGQLQTLVPAFKVAMSAGVRIISQRYPIPGLAHMQCLDKGARLQGRNGRTDPFSWISEIDELATVRGADQTRQDEEYFPDQGPAFLYAHGS